MVEAAMQRVAEVMDKNSPGRAALVAVLMMCFALCACGATAASGDLTLHIQQLKAAVNEGEEIEVTVAFVGGA
jgi:hypothetical protein